MKWLQVVSTVALAGQLTIPAADRDAATPKATPPVLRSSEPSDSVVLKLPGAPVSPSPVMVPTSASASTPFPVPPASIPEGPPVLPASPMVDPQPDPAPVKSLETAFRREPPKSPAEAELRATVRKPKPALPPGFDNDSAIFCQKQIGYWKEADARSLLGDPLHQRPAYDGQKTVNGRIYAFSDPSGRYLRLELDFDKSTGKLRTVFSYPPKMTWQECLRRWGNKVASADAKQGRTFYSYLDLRLDVLVDQNGNVISLGRY